MYCEEVYGRNELYLQLISKIVFIYAHTHMAQYDGCRCCVWMNKSPFVNFIVKLKISRKCPRNRTNAVETASIDGNSFRSIRKTAYINGFYSWAEIKSTPESNEHDRMFKIWHFFFQILRKKGGKWTEMRRTFNTHACIVSVLTQPAAFATATITATTGVAL